MSKSRNWCFTLNNPDMTMDELSNLFGTFKYLIIGDEVGESGTRHFQGYIDFTNPRTLNGIRRINKNIHWEPRKGTWDQAVGYCKKDGKFKEYGQPNIQGARTEIVSITSAIKSGATNKQLYETYGDKAMRISNCIERTRTALFEQNRNWVMDVRIYWGPKGTGKTKAVYDEFGYDGDIYPKMVGKWWQNYNGQKVVLIDDFDPSNCFDITFDFYLKLLDRYPMMIEYKGGSCQFYSKIIIFTSNFNPNGWFEHKTNRDAFFRRVNDIRYFGNTERNRSVGEVILDSPTSSNNVELPTFSGIINDKKGN